MSIKFLLGGIVQTKKKRNLSKKHRNLAAKLHQQLTIFSFSSYKISILILKMDSKICTDPVKCLHYYGLVRKMAKVHSELKTNYLYIRIIIINKLDTIY